MNKIVLIVLTLTSFALQSSFANPKLESLGDGYYVDLSTQKLYGDVGEIEFSNGVIQIVVRADCKRSVIISPKQLTEQTFQQWSIMEVVIKKACKKKWYQIFE